MPRSRRSERKNTITYQCWWYHRREPILFLIILFLVVIGCDAPVSKVSEELTRQFQKSGRSFVNLADVLPIPWEKVCILGPYSDGKAVIKTLGFDWPDFPKTSIPTNESISLLIFLNKNTVVQWIEHRRQDGDFSNLSRQCFSREMAVFEYKANPKKGHPGLFPKE